MTESACGIAVGLQQNFINRTEPTVNDLGRNASTATDLVPPGGAMEREQLERRLAEIDRELLSLIRERVDVAMALAGRSSLLDSEALRRLVENGGERLPVTALEHIWREMAAIPARAGAGLALYCETRADEAELRDLLRYHFGFQATIEDAGDAPDVIRAVSERPAGLGIIVFEERAELPWWRSLGDVAPQIVARLPVLILEGRPADLPALVIARSHTTDPLAPDMAVYDARWRGILPGSLMNSGIEVLAFHRTSEGVDALISVSGEDGADYVRKVCADAGAEPDILRPVGGYAAAIDLDDTPDGDFDAADSRTNGL